MPTTKTNKKPRKQKSEPFNADAEYVTLAEYIRRKHAADLAKDPLAKPIYHHALMGAISKGHIVPYLQGKVKFIDWHKYKNVLFRRYGQMPVKRVK